MRTSLQVCQKLYNFYDKNYVMYFHFIEHEIVCNITYRLPIATVNPDQEVDRALAHVLHQQLPIVTRPEIKALLNRK